MSEVARVGIGMVGGGLIGWCIGFLYMLFFGGMDFNSNAWLAPPGGAVVGIIVGALIVAAA